MNIITPKRPWTSNRFAWIIIPLLLIAAVAAGSLSLFKAHAASPLAGVYSFRAVTTAGPATGQYLTAQLSIQVSGTAINGAACSLVPSQCSVLNGNTPDDINVYLIIHHLAGPTAKFSNVHLVGAFADNGAAHGGITGFTGTFSFTTTAGTSSGSWEAVLGTPQAVSGSWSIYGLFEQGAGAGEMFHATLTLVELPNGHLVGTYCPSDSPCENAAGSDYNGGVYFFVYPVGDPEGYQFRGTVVNSGRINGSVQESDGDKGYFLGHTVI